MTINSFIVKLKKIIHEKNNKNVFFSLNFFINNNTINKDNITKVINPK